LAYLSRSERSERNPWLTTVAAPRLRTSPNTPWTGFAKNATGYTHPVRSPRRSSILPCAALAVGREFPPVEVHAMRRWVLALAVGFSLAGVAGAADSPLKTEFDKYQKTLKEKYDVVRKTANPSDQKELLSEIKEFQVIELDKLFELAEKEPATAPAFDVFSELLFTAVDKEKPKKAHELITKHHVDQPHVKKILLNLAYGGGGDKANDLLKAVAEKNKDKECQGLAAFGLGLMAKMKAKESGGEARKDLLATAEKQFTVVRQQFADVKAGGEALGKMAAGQLLGLKMMDQLQVGKAVPDIAGEDLDGKQFKLSDYKGKVTVLSFWATWCPPCMALVPHEIALVESMKDKPFALIGVNGDELDDTVRKRIADKKITWRSFKNEQPGQPPLAELWDIEGWPTIYVIDHKGVIRHIWTGSPGEKVMDEAIEKLVKEAEKKGE
jgi:thiol-disulfide isomerase/thioredoxin